MIFIFSFWGSILFLFPLCRRKPSDSSPLPLAWPFAAAIRCICRRNGITQGCFLLQTSGLGELVSELLPVLLMFLALIKLSCHWRLSKIQLSLLHVSAQHRFCYHLSVIIAVLEELFNADTFWQFFCLICTLLITGCKLYLKHFKFFFSLFL